jgi:hypothetical protein
MQDIAEAMALRRATERTVRFMHEQAACMDNLCQAIDWLDKNPDRTSMPGHVLAAVGLAQSRIVQRRNETPTVIEFPRSS